MHFVDYPDLKQQQQNNNKQSKLKRPVLESVDFTVAGKVCGVSSVYALKYGIKL